VQDHAPENSGTHSCKNAKKGQNELYEMANLLVHTRVANNLVQGHAPENGGM
jgi:hypothetical protein